MTADHGPTDVSAGDIQDTRRIETDALMAYFKGHPAEAPSTLDESTLDSLPLALKASIVKSEIGRLADLRDSDNTRLDALTVNLELLTHNVQQTRLAQLKLNQQDNSDSDKFALRELSGDNEDLINKRRVAVQRSILQAKQKLDKLTNSDVQFVDFHRQQIENEKLKKALHDLKTQTHLLKASSTSSTVSGLKHTIRNLAIDRSECDRLILEIQNIKSEIAVTDSDIADERGLKAKLALVSHGKAPEVLKLANAQAELQRLKREKRNLEKKCEIRMILREGKIPSA